MTERSSLSPTISQLMEHYVFLRFDRGLIERLHQQRPAVDQAEAPDLFRLFGVFELLVTNVWGMADVGDSFPAA